MEHNVIDDYIKCEIDLEAVSTLLNKVYEKEKDSLQQTFRRVESKGVI